MYELSGSKDSRKPGHSESGSCGEMQIEKRRPGKGENRAAAKGLRIFVGLRLKAFS